MKSLATRLILALALVLAGVGVGVLIARPRPEPPAPASAGELWTCSMHPQVIRDKPGVCPICFMKLVPLRKGVDAPGVVRIDPALTQTMGLRTEVVEEGPLSVLVRAVGEFREAEPRRHEVTLRVSGWIDTLYADTEGARVKKGDPLFELYSPELLVAQNELLAAKRALDRLPNSDDARRLHDGAIERLRLLDVPRETIDGILSAGRPLPTIRFLSPADGFILEKTVARGSAVEPSRPLFRIVDLSTLWLDARVYEAQLARVALGQKATARVAAFPGRDFPGEVVFVSPRVDPGSRTAAARLAFPNPDLSLRPGLYASVELEAPVAERALLVPREAVIDTGRRQVAFVAKEAGRFEARDVRMGAENAAGRVQILSGLAKGETVVVSGQFLLDAESRVREAIRKLSDPTPPAPAHPPGHLSMVQAYLALAETLASDKAVETAAVDTLIAAAKAEGATKVAEAVEHLCCVPLKEQREKFKALSEAVIALKPEGVVYRCEMANARWLQKKGPPRNPYMGSSMLGCGELVR